MTETRTLELRDQEDPENDDVSSSATAKRSLDIAINEEKELGTVQVKDSSDSGYEEHIDVSNATAFESSEGDVDHADYGYEEATPAVQRRNQKNATYRRNSLLDKIMVWAGVVNDEEFYRSSFSGESGQVPVRTNRRASMDWAMTGTSRSRAEQNKISQPRQRFPSSDDVALMDHDEDDKVENEGEGYAENGDEYNNGVSRAPRRNSLHAMVERAMAYVNSTKDANDDDLTPFGNRRDSLF